MLLCVRYNVLQGLENESSSSSFAGTSSKVVLIEDFPHFAIREPKEFQMILTKFKNSSRGNPLVMIVSEGSKEDILR